MNRIAAVLVIVFFILPAAAAGACSIWSGVNMVSQPSNEYSVLVVIPIFIGIVAFAALYGFAILFRNLWKG